MSANLATRGGVNLLPLGTRVSFHHRAAVARIRKHPFRDSHKPEHDRPRGWILVDMRWNEWRGGFTTDSLKDMFFDWPQAKGSYKQHHNKTVMVWPDSGFGVIIGIVRRAIGRSRSGYRSSYSGEFEEGYFEVEQYVDLYVVKCQYEGTDFILCPLWSVKELSDGNG